MSTLAAYHQIQLSGGLQPLIKSIFYWCDASPGLERIVLSLVYFPVIEKI